MKTNCMFVYWWNSELSFTHSVQTNAVVITHSRIHSVTLLSATVEVNLPISQSFNRVRSTGNYIRHGSHLASQSVSQSVGQSVSQCGSVSQSINHALSHSSMSKSVTHTASQLVCQSIRRTDKQTVSQSICKFISYSIGQLVNQLVSHSVLPSVSTVFNFFNLSVFKFQALQSYSQVFHTFACFCSFSLSVGISDFYIFQTF